ncbi:hypothetical protein NPIL_5271 [Nephila pilipes]|uniref:Uncharacterized protein n=1 Tax=Nephila pilipes TaxID=299642 RepID=A0A8X6NBC1_NEPPI|nr:hypothetical protein NPIL_5271 [Nephila pilipes]
METGWGGRGSSSRRHFSEARPPESAEGVIKREEEGFNMYPSMKQKGSQRSNLLSDRGSVKPVTWKSQVRFLLLEKAQYRRCEEVANSRKPPGQESPLNIHKAIDGLYSE